MKKKLLFKLVWDQEDGIGNCREFFHSNNRRSHFISSIETENEHVTTQHVTVDEYYDTPTHVGFYILNPVQLGLEQKSSARVNHGEQQQNLAFFIPSKIVNLLNRNNSNLFLVVDWRYEGWDMQYPKPVDSREFFKYCIGIHNIPPDRIYFIHGNLNPLSSTYDGIGIPLKNIYQENDFENQQSVRTFTNPVKPNIRSKNFNNITKKFVFKNHVLTGHRIFLVDYLLRKQALDQCHWSLASYEYDYQILEYHNKLTHFYYDNEHEAAKGAMRVVKLLNGKPKRLDWVEGENWHDWTWDDHLKFGIYNDSLFSLVTETTMDEGNKELLFLTEKSFLPINAMHPFVIAGCYGTLAHLRDLGYKTFPELFDESYDTYKDYKDRMNVITKNIDRIVSTPMKKLAKIFSSSTTLDKVEHNFNNLINANTRLDSPYTRTLKILIEIFNGTNSSR